MEKISIDKASMKDMPRISEIYAYARNFMKENGNPTQWEDLEAIHRNLLADIEHENLYLIKSGNDIHGAFAFIIGEDPTYAKIEQGEWISDKEYGTIHRVASDGVLHGILRMSVEFCSKKISHLRIDTHEDNIVMQHLIIKNGFRKCGIIHIADGSLRIAYEKI